MPRVKTLVGSPFAKGRYDRLIGANRKENPFDEKREADEWRRGWEFQHIKLKAFSTKIHRRRGDILPPRAI